MTKSSQSKGTKTAAMPGQFYAYLFVGLLLTAPVAPFVVDREIRAAGEVWQLSALTLADPRDPNGAVHRGTLRGPTGRTTALGGAALRWARVVAWLTGGILVAHGLCLSIVGVVSEIAVLRAR